MRSIFCLLYFIFVVINPVKTQDIKNSIEGDSFIISKFNTSLNYLKSFKNDSASLVLDSLLVQLSDLQLTHTPVGLKVRLAKAQALERDNKGDAALIKLLELKVESSKMELWEVYVNACINLALVYEKVGKATECLNNLRDAGNKLAKHSDLDHLYPFYCIRISSYHRIYNSKDSAQYYAQECLRTYKKHNAYEHGADAYMLMTMLSADEGIDAQLTNAKASVNIFRKLENHTGMGYMLGGISTFYLLKKDYKKALDYNDSTIISAKNSIAGGFDVYLSLYSGLKQRGKIYEQMQQYDSAIHYIHLGYELQNQHIQKESKLKVLEIDAKYQNDKNELIIIEQEKQLNNVIIQRKLLMIIFSLVVIFTLGLTYYYNKLKSANQQTKQQTEQIKQSNKELTTSLKKQTLLQGEVHHRVKNNLQVIISLLDLQKDKTKDLDSKNHLDSMSKRIYSMAAIHNLLYQKEDMEHIILSEYVKNLCFHFSNFSIESDKPIFNISIDDINLNLETSMPIGIVISELLNNSLKYGRIEGRRLIIDINIHRKDEGIFIVYQDNGPGFPNDVDESSNKGLGFYILKSMIRQLQGKMSTKSKDGAYFEIYVLEKNKWKEEA
ncbi:MAG: sensor histidine kinase [Saprospiraceae bacterium]|nr:sensor histidine kinase [Saprospiraceae bacterium]